MTLRMTDHGVSDHDFFELEGYLRCKAGLPVIPLKLESEDDTKRWFSLEGSKKNSTVKNSTVHVASNL